MFDAVLSLIQRRFWLVLYAGLLFGVFAPGDWQALVVVVPWALGVILFLTCLTVDLHSVWAEVAGWRAIIRLVIAVLVLQLGVPLLAWQAAMAIDPTWATGVLLLAAMPAGVSSAALAATQRGHVALALVVVLTASAVSPLSVPLLLRLAGGPADAAAVGLLGQAGFIAVALGGAVYACPIGALAISSHGRASASTPGALCRRIAWLHDWLGNGSNAQCFGLTSPLPNWDGCWLSPRSFRCCF